MRADFWKNCGKWGTIVVACLTFLFSVSCEKSGLIDPTILELSKQIKIAEFSSVKPAVGLGGETTDILVRLVDGTGNPYPDGVVLFQSLIGTITPVDTTDADGIARALYISGATAGVDTITALVANNPEAVAQKQLLIDIIVVSSITISASKAVLLADGEQSTELVIFHKDGAGNPLSETNISFFTDFGSVTQSVTTDPFGRATAVYTTPPSSIDSTVSIIAFSSSSQLAKTADAEPSLSRPGEEQKQKILEKILARSEARSDTTTIRLIGIKLSLSASPDSIGATGTTKSTIAAVLTTTQDSALASRQVSFSTNFGALSASTAITDGSGKAEVQLQSVAVTGVSTVTATFAGGITAQTFVHFTSGSQELVTLALSANPTEISADGTSSSEITVIVKNTQNNPVQNAEVLFSTTLGRIDATAVTDEIGVAQANLYSDRSDGIAVVTAEYTGVKETTQVGFTGTQLTVTAEPEALVANNSTLSAITVTLKDGAGIPIESVSVELQTDNGAFTNDSTEITGITNVNGIFIDSLKSGEEKLTTVTVSAAGTQASTTLSFTRLVTTLVPDTNVVIANTLVRLIFTITDLDGYPQRDIPVIFTPSLGEVTPSESTTDTGGQAITFFKSPIGGVATVTAKVISGLITPDPPTATITIVSAPPSSINLIIDPVVVAVNGGEANLIAIVIDSSGNPVSDQTVNFQIVAGPAGGESVDPPFSITGATGSALSVFKSGSIGSNSVNSVMVRAAVQEFSLSAEERLTIAGEPTAIVTSPSPPPIDNKDGTFSLAIGSIVSDINGNPVVDGTLVYFSSLPPIGVITSPVATQGGIVSTQLVYPIDSAGDNVKIIATSGDISDTLEITQLPTAGVAGFVDSIRFIGAQSASILADGQSTTQFKVLVIDPTKNPVAGVIVDFTAQPGNSGTGLTEEQNLPDGSQNPDWGVASFSLKSVSSKQDLFPIVVASAGGKIARFQENGVADPLNPFFLRGITLTVDSDEDTIKTGGTATIHVILKETTRKVALSRSVTFGSDFGFIVNTGQTDTRGELFITFEAGPDTGLAKIIATFGTDITDSTFIYIKGEEPEPPTLTVSADNSELLADGEASTDLIIQYRDAAGNPISGETVTLFTDFGTVTSSVTTGFLGKAVATYTVPPSEMDSTAAIFVFSSAVSDTIAIQLIGIKLSVSASPDTINASGSSRSNISAVLKTTRDSTLVSRTISFATNLGTLIPSTAITDGNGLAVVQLQSVAVTGVSTVTATFAGGISAQTLVHFTSVVPDTTLPANIFLSADTSFIKIQGAVGLNSTRITAKVTDANNESVISGITVQLITSLGTFASTETSTVTLQADAKGEVSAQLQSGDSVGVATITAISGGITVSEDLVTIQAGLPDNILVSADTAGTLLAGNLVQINVTALITDLNGNPVASNTPVSFYTGDDGSGDNPVVTIVRRASTDEFGIVRSTLTYALSDIGKGLRITVTTGGVSAFKDIKLPNIQ